MKFIMQLVVDIGNTLIKLAIFNGHTLLAIKSFTTFNEVEFVNFLSDYQIKSSILSSVRENDDHIVSFLSGLTALHILDHKTPLPFKNKYASPETLGRDRIAAAAGAVKLFPNENTLVIDAGSSITYEFINCNSEYLGGGISPGLQMRFKALNTFTGKLPLINFSGENLPKLIGDNTQNSILSGVFNGYIKEIEGIIEEYKSIFEKLTIIVSGGDHKYFDKLLKYKTFAAPNLVLEGLKGILDFNEDK